MMDKAKLLLGLITEEEFAKTEEKQEIQELSPEQKEAQRSLQMAKVLLGRGFGSKAMPNLEKAIQLDPSLTEARLLAGRIYIEEEKYPEAREQFEKVLEANPKSNDARVGIGSVLIAEGNLDGAEEELKKAITLNPDPAMAMFRLGQVYEKKGEVQKAMETYRDALEIQLKKAAKGK
jgi:Tfp pilus assembly protein PilF